MNPVRLLDRLAKDNPVSQVFDHFLEHVKDQRLELYPAQEEAILELYAGKNVILNTPTGSGKSLVATSLHLLSYASGRRSVYTCPIKALVNEKFLNLCRDFGPDQVGMITGDGAVNGEARILCCTAEILAQWALRQGSQLPIDDIIMDEFHYYSDRERGVSWQIPLLTLSRARFLLMSATLGDTQFFEKSLRELTGVECVLVSSTHRPVPLEFRYEEIPLHETVAKLIGSGRAPVYVVNFTQRECAEEAQNFLSSDFCSKQEKAEIAENLKEVRFSSPYGKEFSRVLRHGVGIHHAGLLPKYRVLVEKLAQKGLLKIICGTDTLGVGVNVPIRSVLFTKLCKFDGQKTSLLSVRDFKQIAGRAGRKGFDDLGTVVAQAPEHVVENLRNEQKAAGDPKKLKKLVKRKPPEKGYVPWSKETFEKLHQGNPETLSSRFQISHGMLMLVLGRKNENGARAMKELLRRCHENEHSKKQLRKKGFQLFRSLVDRKIIELNPLRVNVDLQDDFSLHHTLSLYLLDAIAALNPVHPEFALDVLTLVESIVEDPDPILRRQLDRVKDKKMAELKQEGMEFDQRIEELEKLEYPKPRRDFIYETFNAFSNAHPWVGQENIRPKSVAREMYELFISFPEYIREYDLQRSEGLLLRYLSEVYKTLVQSVPELLKNDEIRSIEEYFGTMIRQVDSTLLDEWQRMRSGGILVADPEQSDSFQAVKVPLKDSKKFRISVRNEIFRVVRALATANYAEASELGRYEGSATDIEKLMEQYHVEHARILTDTRARNPQNTYFRDSGSGGAGYQEIEQILNDSDEHNDWSLTFVLDLKSSEEAGIPVLKLTRIGECDKVG